ncbi:hypothetical protein ACJ73_05872 [Blastomyces percursus]|uniref:Uncharacterized protein n=1 Tax=Blastomyces percursus TaxID=1658174 RepID=A0A1J9Q3V3_9EURO|nr:hypothetical protein ACJ73_05872 [Blastomyces percursus]
MVVDIYSARLLFMRSTFDSQKSRVEAGTEDLAADGYLDKMSPAEEPPDEEYPVEEPTEEEPAPEEPFFEECPVEDPSIEAYPVEDPLVEDPPQEELLTEKCAIDEHPAGSPQETLPDVSLYDNWTEISSIKRRKRSKILKKRGLPIPNQDGIFSV